ncbi:substrate-binding domain-containing protein [uncultured Cohaesibacter sp.]|uniref:substrate-binding domain-containing protein n=1 Tax=uncultured Cohaesibacter sp. TaxID=1002546 RepID=UPI0029C93B93|nr:substrate-binding domain-containing protein [uncultured Cohaesibacter sp.]
MTNFNINRRSLLTAAGGLGLAGLALPQASKEALAAGEGLEYVFLSIVTQVPFWADHRAALKDLEAQLNIKTTFTGPLDFDTAAQARQLDELVARRPAGIMIFPGDPATLAPGVARAVEAGIPVTTCIGDIPDSPRSTFLGINGFEAGKVGGELLAQAIGGKGKVLMGTFPAPATLQRVEGYKATFKEKYPEIEVVDVVNDRADPSFAPTAYLQALQAHPDVVGIGGTGGDSGKGAAIAVQEFGKAGEIKIVAMDRNDDMLPYIEDGTIYGAIAQKSYLEMFLAVHLMHWQNINALKVLPDWQNAGVELLPERVETGVMTITQENVAQFKH